MSIKSFIGKKYAQLVVAKTKKWSENPIQTQEKVLQQLISTAAKTAFGKDHNFSTIKTYEDFKSMVPVRDYEGLKHYIERIKKCCRF